MGKTSARVPALLTGSQRFSGIDPLQARRRFVIRLLRGWPLGGEFACSRALHVFPGSSVVEQPAVNRLVAGSNPARGATSFLVSKS